MAVGIKTVNRRFFHIPVLVIWLVAALGVPFQFVLQSTPNVMIVNLLQDLHINEVSVGFLTSSFFYTYLLFQVPAGLIVDRYGARIVLSLSVFLGALACVQFALADTLSVAAVSRLIMGLVTAPCVPAVMYVAAKNFSPGKFVILAGLAESIGMTGGAVGEPILGEIVTHLGWRNTMLTCALVGIIIALLMFALIRDRQGQLQEKKADDFKQIVVGFGRAMQNSQVWFIVLFGALIFAGLPALAGLWIVQALQDLHHVSLEVATFGSFAMFIGTAIGLPFWGWFSEKIRKRRPVMFIATAANLLITSSFIYLKGMSLAIVFIQLFFMGFVCAVYVLAFALVRERTNACIRASAMGLTNMMTMVIGGLILQPLIGAILKYYKITGRHELQNMAQLNLGYQNALSSVLICLVLAFIVIFFIKETYCTSQVESES